MACMARILSVSLLRQRGEQPRDLGVTVGSSMLVAHGRARRGVAQAPELRERGARALPRLRNRKSSNTDVVVGEDHDGAVLQVLGYLINVTEERGGLMLRAAVPLAKQDEA